MSSSGSGSGSVGECGGRICCEVVVVGTNDKSDTRGQVMVTEALEATVISSSPSSSSSSQSPSTTTTTSPSANLGSQQIRREAAPTTANSTAASANQLITTTCSASQQATKVVSLIVNNIAASNNIASVPCSTTSTPIENSTTKKCYYCNICHQEILATFQSPPKTINKNSNQTSNSVTKEYFLASSQKNQAEESISIANQCNNQLTKLSDHNNSSGGVCLNCSQQASKPASSDNSRGLSDDLKQQPQEDHQQESLSSGGGLINSNSSFLFWKFLSNLPRSINQRSKSGSSNTLTPEVAGYLASKKLNTCGNSSSGNNNEEDTVVFDNMNFMAVSPIATTNYEYSNTTNQNDDKKTITTSNTSKTMKTSDTSSIMAQQQQQQQQNISQTSADCHLRGGGGGEHRLINIVVPSGCESDEQQAAHLADFAQQQAELNIAVNDPKHLGSQIKLSIATTTTATRSSASSLSSCILSDSTSTSEVRLKWGKKMDFLLSIIGFAVDLANIWRFPYLVYKNGGGVFLIPYVTMLIFGGIPLFFLELCLGQYVKKGPITVWNKICPAMKGVGYCSILISWSLLSFGEKMPWEECDNSWNSNVTCVSISQLKTTCSARNEPLDTCRKSMYNANVTSPASEFFVKELSQIDQSSGLEDMGHLRMELVICLLIVYLLHYFSLFRGLETSGKVVWVTATAPYMILSILLVRGLFLPGASMGIEFYLSPKLERLNDPQVWIDAAGQVFYSIGVGFGVHLTYASFNSHNNNCYRDCLMTSAVNVITSVYSGLVVFVYLGYMAKNLGIEIDKVANEGYSLVFEVYPEALTTLPFARFWSILFFIMLLTLGIDSAMGGLEAVITGLEDEFKFAKRLSRGQLTGLVIVSSFLPALISCTQGGAYTLYWFDIYSAGISLLFAALFETIGVVYCYGLKKFITNIESMLGRGPHLFFILCWKYISPIFLGGVIFMQIYTASKITYRNYTYPVWSIALGWCLAFSSVAAIPIVAICYWYNHKWHRTLPDKSLRKRGASSVASSSRHGSSKKSPNHRSVSQVSYSGGGQNATGGPITTILAKQQPHNQYIHQHQMVGIGGGATTTTTTTTSCRTREEMV